MLAVITIVHGRHDHLALQQAGLHRSTHRPDLHVVVAMDDLALEEDLDPVPWPRRIVHLARSGRHLPLARARNIGAQTAIAAGATTLVFLDVDCVPAEPLLAAYAAAATHAVTCRDLLCGPVTYLPPPPAGGYDLTDLDSLAEPHAARPAPPAGTVERTRHGYELFWSLSFALSHEAWYDIGGFDEAYVGYGGEDTDFARRAEGLGTALTWVGDARAFHQHHPVSTPPVEHVEDVVRNATLFHERWGEWPMTGWLTAFEERGLVRRRADGSYGDVR
ncbi:glycosyltransferase family 2 protein [Aeromicrobium chenweiae]|nr:galactosyltransferase-related protein [Aeromicrobium chenweiae]